MTEKKLRLGIIGIGTWALMSHVPILKKIPRAEIVAICRRSEEALARAQAFLGVPEAYTDWREMLDKSEIDAALVCTPHTAHLEPTLAALDRGLHVLIEKPISLTSEDAWTIVRAAEQSDRILTVAYGPRFTGAWRAAKAAVEEGAIGPIRQINVALSTFRRWLWGTEEIPAATREWVQATAAAFSQRSGVPLDLMADWTHKDHWRRDPAQFGGGTLVGVGTHSVDLALWLAGAPAAQVVAFAESQGLPVECFINVQARLANGVLFSLTAADIPEDSTRWSIYGDRGILTSESGEVWIQRGGKRKKVEAATPEMTPDGAFVATVLDGAPNLCTAREGAYAVALVEAAYLSAAEGRIVDVETP